MTDYTDTARKIRKVRKLLQEADVVVRDIDDSSPHLMTLNTLVPSLIAKCDRYLDNIYDRKKKSESMKKRKASA